MKTLPLQPHLTRKSDPAILKLTKFLDELSRQEFYGKVTISFEAGRIQIIKQEQTIRPSNLS